MLKKFRFPFITEGFVYEFGNTEDILGDAQQPYDRTEDIHHKRNVMFDIASEEGITITMVPEIIELVNNGRLIYNKYTVICEPEIMSRFAIYCQWLIEITDEQANDKKYWQDIYDNLMQTYRYGYIVDGCRYTDYKKEMDEDESIIEENDNEI